MVDFAAAGSSNSTQQTSDQQTAQPTDAQVVGSNAQTQAAAAAAASQPSSTGANGPTFDPSKVPAASLTNDTAGLGLPTSDQTIIAELRGTPIYIGDTTSTAHAMAGDTGSTALTAKTPNYQTADKLVKQLETMDRSDVIKLQQQLIQGQWLSSGYVPSGIVDAPTEVAYLKLLATTANYQQNGQNVTPDQVLGMSGQPGGGVTTSVSSVDLSDPMTARGVINSMMEQYLGRAPTSSDIQGFVSGLQGYETEHPGTTTTTTTPGGGGNVKEKSVSKTGGMGSSLSLRGGDVAAAEQYIDQQHGAEEAQVGIDQLTAAFSSLLGLK